MSSIFTGSVDDYLSSGEGLTGRLIDLAGLTPGSSVLDVGSGMGRLAVALMPVLGPSGRYEGLDIVPSGIRWCEENITARRPEFRFTLADIRNSEYNPDGRTAASVNGHLKVPTGGHEKYPPRSTSQALASCPPPLVRASFIR